MLNFRSFRVRFPQRRLIEDCDFRKRASEQWQESVTAYYEAVQMLAQHREYEAVYKSAEKLRLLSKEIKQILEDHEREHGCGPVRCGISNGRIDGPATALVGIADDVSASLINPMTRQKSVPLLGAPPAFVAIRSLRP